jgi:predicted PurR-regulated permease PerM
VERAETQKRWSNVVFGLLFLASVLLFGRILLPFIMPVLLGGFLTVLFQPVHDRLCRLAPRRRALCAGVSTVAVLALIVVPLGVTAYFLGKELLLVVDDLRRGLSDVALRQRVAEVLPPSLARVVLTMDPSPEGNALVAAVAGSAAFFRDLLGRGTGMALDVFLMSVSMYYFFIDGRRLYAEAARLLPLEKRYLDAFAKEFKDVALAIVYGNSVTALIQGAVGLVGLWLAGVPHPLVWALAMAVVALVPVGGTALVWAPLGVVLMLTGKLPEGIFLLAWGALVVGTVDNLVRPRLCGSRMALHPLLVFLSMFGGLAVFGMMGLLVGPLIASLFMAMVRIYRRDFLGQASAAVDRLAAPVPHKVAEGG